MAYFEITYTDEQWDRLEEARKNTKCSEAVAAKIVKNVYRGLYSIETAITALEEG